MAKVLVRKATQADYEGIMDIIPDLYEGRDYMPAFYHPMSKDPNRFLSVAEFQGEIVAFAMQYVVDDGKCYIDEAGRTKEAFRRKGILGQLTQFALSQMYKVYPMITERSATTYNEQIVTNVADQPSVKTFYRDFVIISMDSYEVWKTAMSSPEFDRLYKSLPMNRTHPLTPSDAVRQLDYSPDRKNLLTEFCWVVDYEPFKPTHSNHVIITHNNTRGIAVVVVTKDDQGNSTALSFGTVTPIKTGVLFLIDFYCHKSMQTNSAGKQLLSAHMVQHMIIFYQVRYDGMPQIEVMLPREMDTGSVLEYYNAAGMDRYNVVVKKQKLYCVEHKILPNM